MITLESAQIFFYISIGACTIGFLLIYIITRLPIFIGIRQIIKRILNIINEVQEKLNIAKKIIDKVKDKATDIEFYLEKLERLSDFFKNMASNRNDKTQYENFYTAKKEKKKKKRK
jgi:hypothetical protein